MKNLFKMKWGIMVLMIAVAFAFGACEVEEDDKAGEGDDGNIWTDYTSGYSIQVRNHSSFDLVAFADEPSATTILGAVRGPTANSHGFGPNSTYFGAAPKSFRMVFLTAADYNEYKTNLPAAKQKIITSMFVFWNGNSGSNDKVYEIDASMGGDYKFEVVNPSNMNVELRTKGPSGPTLGYAPNGIDNVIFYTSDPELTVFPIFLWANTTREIIETVYPTMTLQGQTVPARRSLNLETGTTGVRQFNLNTIIQGMNGRRTGSSFLTIVNAVPEDVGAGDMVFLQGGVVQFSATGTRTISATKPREQRFDMEKNGDDYRDSRVIGSLEVQFGGIINVGVVQKEDKTKTTFTLKSDYSYTLLAEPDPLNPSFIIATIAMDENDDNGPEPFKVSGGTGVSGF